MSLLRRLWPHIQHNRRKQFVLLLLLMLLASLSEILSIGAVLPFLGVLTSPEKVYELSVIHPIKHLLGLTDPKDLLFPFALLFAILSLMAGVMRLMLLWVNTRLSFAVGADISMSIYQRTLYQPYSVHCARNSSEVIDGISGKANGVIYSIIVPVLTLVSSSIMLIGILIALLIVEPIIAMVAFGGFSLIYIAIIWLTRNQLRENSISIARESTQVIKSLQEGLGGIRDVLIDGSQSMFCDIYRKADLVLRRSQGSSLFIAYCPRYGIEAFGMVLISALAYILAQSEYGIAKAIPILGVLALSAQRLLPILQQAYGSWAQINAGQISLKDTLDLLDQPLPNYVTQSKGSLSFDRCLVLKNIYFQYHNSAPFVLKGLDLEIRKGSRVGFIGPTGSGKSTLLDIIMGLLEPTKGIIEVDGKTITPENNRAWQTHIAHVPQAIFLTDSTIEQNIAFGVPEDQIDTERVIRAAQQAQISDVIETWPEKYQTMVGERGIRLSGGQRQRIGIARALYKQADVIIFDEATSALDSETEQSVMNAIEGLSKDLTLLIIAHRLTTLKSCTKIVDLVGGSIRCVGKYQDIINL